MTISELIIAIKEATGISDEGLRDTLKIQGVHVSTQSVIRWRNGFGPHKGSVESVTTALQRIIADAS